MKSILIAEDDRALGDGLCLALKDPALELTLCRTLSAARSALEAGGFDLLILDVNLPDGNGLDFLRRLRAGANSVPVILLTANDMETDIVAGLESGADDYVTKPFSLAVLRARVNAQLRRDRGAVPSGPLVLDGFSFDFERMEFRRDGRSVDLSKTEQKLLRILVENRGRTLPRELLVDRVWTGGAEYVDENALSVTVKRLRGKLEENPSKPRYLKTVYGIGYTWTTGEKEG
ncbi:response regulator transcription factor [uncultured Oscillibacter sp.]|uniref:response regulator transcription factor n=1 Tax=uncultured Oscillibacter sp. TaxID=876091 RepID=UPI00217219B8|nr:response regulator transcription factor [uncultured Oscillibacter sp.]MCI9010944.1 response regulator transcription factor [Oscillibacter sp.]